MATQLTGLKSLLDARNGGVVHVPARVLTAVCAVAVVATMTSMAVAIRSAHRDQRAAQARFADAQTLLAVPPLSGDSLKDDLASVQASLATAQAEAAPPALDPASDSTTALLVTRAQAAGLAVRAIARIAPSQAKLGDALYGVQGVKMTIDAQPQQIVAFLDALDRSDPSLIARLIALTVNDPGVAHAEIDFDVFTKVASPTPAPRTTPGAAR